MTMPASVTQKLINRLAVFLLGLLGLQALLATPLLAWYQFTGTLQFSGYAFAVAVAGMGLFVAWRLGPALERAIQGLARTLTRQSDARWLLWMILLGLALRLLWIALFPATPKSDGATYLYLAGRLQAGAPYEADGTRAYWPPGYPLFLVPWLYLPLASQAAVILSNLALFSATTWVTFRLASQAGGALAARLATLMLTLWPTYVANSGLPEKENLAILLLPLAFWLYLCGRGKDHLVHGKTLAAGLVLGAAALVQPAIQLFFTVFLAYELATRSSMRQASLALGLLVLGMGLAIAPWTARNILVLGKPVLIATNGGDVLYRANNPLATGGWTARGEVDLAQYDELTRSREGVRLAKEWIVGHPADFVRLSLWKQMLFLGDDSGGVYGSLRRGGG